MVLSVCGEVRAGRRFDLRYDQRSVMIASDDNVDQARNTKWETSKPRPHDSFFPFFFLIVCVTHVRPLCVVECRANNGQHTL